MDQQRLENALKGYLEAAYGDPKRLDHTQLKEVRQAFLAGILWRDTEVVKPGACEAPLRSMLGIDAAKN